LSEDGAASWAYVTDQWSAIIMATAASWCFVRWELSGLPGRILVLWLLCYPLVRLVLGRKELPGWLKWLGTVDRWLKELDSLALWLSITGVIIIVSFGFGRVLPLNPLFVRASWESWMKGSVLWTMLMAVYYFNVMRKIPGPAASGVMLVFFISFGAATSFLLKGIGPGPSGPARHVWLAVAVGFCMCAIDCVVLRSPPNDLQREKSWNSLMFADFPALLAFLVLGLYVRMRPQDSHIFVSGAIAFQLFSGKVVFIVIESLKRDPIGKGSKSIAQAAG
jgi:hypothetical protein